MFNRAVRLTGFVMAVLLGIGAIAEQPSWSVASSSEWKQATSMASGIRIQDERLVLERAANGRWTSHWYEGNRATGSLQISVEAAINLFDNKTIEVVVDGSETPFVDEDHVPHDWYGRCMIAIVDEKHWVMALRSGVNHVAWGDRDAIHIITSSDEGRSWSELNRWFDGASIEGMPYEDGHTHSEPGLYKMPNGDLILQFWRIGYSSGTTQLRSRDNGKTWVLDADQINVEGVTGVDANKALGTEDYFVDPENPSAVYMAFQYIYYGDANLMGTLLARSRDNGKSYKFLSWIGPLASRKDPHSGATFEPAIEYVGNRTIVAVLRDGAGSRYTWQSESTDMGASFSPLVDITRQIDGGVYGGWKRVRLYKESNPYFQYNNRLNYALGEGRLWGVGFHDLHRSGTRKPAVYWSDDNGKLWNGPELLHGPMYPGTDTGYGDLKRRIDNTFVAATYYAYRDPTIPQGQYSTARHSSIADVEQYTFGGDRVSLRVEIDRDDDGSPDADSGWREVYNGQNVLSVKSLAAGRWRLSLLLRSTDTSGTPEVSRVSVKVPSS